MELGSVDFDEKEAMDESLQRAKKLSGDLMRRCNVHVLECFNRKFTSCFQALLDLSEEGYGKSIDELSSYFSELETVAAVVNEWDQELQENFIDVVAEEIVVLTRAFRDIGAEWVFIERVGKMPDSIETVQYYLRELIKPKEHSFEEITKTGGQTYDAIVRDSFRLGDIGFDDLSEFDDAGGDTFRPSSVDQIALREAIARNPQGIASKYKWQLLIAAGFAGFGVTAAGSFYAVRDPSVQKVESKQQDAIVEDTGSKVPVTTVTEKERPSWVCRVDTTSKAYTDYFERIKNGNSIFVRNFQDTVDTTVVTGWTQDKARRPLALMVLTNLQECSDDKLTQEVADVHYMRVLNYEGGAWQSGARETERFYSAMTPQCELR